MIATKKYFPKCFIMTGILAAFIVISISNFAASTRLYTTWLDINCNFYFDSEKFYDDIEAASPSKWANFETCYNETYNSERNLTRAQRWDCQIKCEQIDAGHLNEDGTFNDKLPEIVEKQYKKYSNATAEYVNKVTKMFTRCAKEASENLKLLEIEGTMIGECKINRLYEDCCMGIIKRHFLKPKSGNITEEGNEVNEFCGTE